MPEAPRQIFREQSLEKLSSPDRLDEMLRIVNPPAWILLGTMGIGMALVLLWSLFGRIPAAVHGTAILVRPKQVVGFQSRATGPIREIRVSVGDVVLKDQVLALVHLPQIEKLLEQERAKLAHFQQRSGRMTELELGLADKEKSYIVEQRAKILDRANKVEESARSARESDRDYIEKQRINVETARGLLAELRTKLEEQNERSADLAEQRLLRVTEAIEAQRQQIDSELRLAELVVKESELDLREILSVETYNSQLDLAKDLRIQVDALNLRELEIERRLALDKIVNDTEIDDIQRRIGQLESQLENEGGITSEYTGRVLEITVTQGQHVSIGQRLGKLEIEDASKGLQALAYFPIKDGKKLKPGLSIRVSPATVERERFGAIRGSVQLVSDYPITTEAAANQIGDLEVARSLLGGESRIEVLADLDTDALSPTGFAWTSGHGPEKVQITPGTTASVRVTIEERAPITLLLPFLKSLSDS